MEFLLTYGWAITIVIVAVAAMAYFGVLDGSRFAPTMCTLPPGLSCMDHSVTTNIGGTQNNFKIVIKNNLGHQISIINITSVYGGRKIFNPPFLIENGDSTSGGQLTVNDVTNKAISGIFFPKDSKYKFDCTFAVNNTEINLVYSFTGTVTGKVI